MFFSTRCIAMRRLAFSLACDSAQALNKMTKRDLQINPFSVRFILPTTFGCALPLPKFLSLPKYFGVIPKQNPPMSH